MDKMFCDEKKRFKITFKNKLGLPAKVDGAADLTLSDDSLASLEDLSDDRLSGIIAGKGIEGAVVLIVKADPDLGEGKKELERRFTVELLPAEANDADFELVEVA